MLVGDLGAPAAGRHLPRGRQRAVESTTFGKTFYNFLLSTFNNNRKRNKQNPRESQEKQEEATLDDFYIIIYQLIMYCAKPYFPCALPFFCLPFRS